MLSSPDPAALGCYGIILDGLPRAASRMTPLPADCPRYSVAREILAADARERPPESLTGTSAVLHLSDGTGTAHVDRAGRSIVFTVRQDYSDEAVLHPLMAGSAAAINRWLGRDSFHAGAFVLEGRAWVLLGDKGHGKSSTLGYLASHGVPVVADDLIVEDAGNVLAGPAFVDLRPDAARALGAGRDLGVLGQRSRARLDVPPIGNATPLAGWITLEWGNEVALSPIPVEKRLPILYAHRSVRRAPVDPATFLRHVSRPCYVLQRPRRWDVMPEVLAALTGAPLR